MAFKVKLTAPAESDAYGAFERISEVAPLAARRWLERLFEAIFSLSEMPQRCSIAHEAEEIGREVRQLLFGKKSGTFRILFDIQNDAVEGPVVRVLRIWRGSRDDVQPEDLEE
jgi:plasmid stabilization system protein ParE